VLAVQAQLQVVGVLVLREVLVEQQLHIYLFQLKLLHIMLLWVRLV
jgi:hypothetical protein